MTFTQAPRPSVEWEQPSGKRTRSRLWPNMRTSTVLQLALSLIVLVLVAFPMYRLVNASLHTGGPFESSSLTLENYRASLIGPRTLQLVINSLTFATGQMIVSMTFGVLLAWIVVRTDVPWRRLWELTTIGLFFIPLLVAGTAWSILLGPRNGLLNVAIRALTGLEGFNIYSMFGMVLIQGLYYVPLVYLIAAASFRSVNPELEEASRISGASPWSTFLRVTLSVCRPAVLAAAALSFITGVGSMEVPLLFGFPGRVSVLTSDVYSALRVHFPPDYGRAAAVSVVLLVFGIAVLWLFLRLLRHSQRYVTLGGRGYRLTPVRLGRSRWVVFAACAAFATFTIVLPLLAVLVGSLLPYIGAPSRQLFASASLENYETVWTNPVLPRAIKNTLALAIGAGVAVMVLGALIAYVSARLRTAWSKAIDLGASVTITIPGIVLASAVFFAYVTFVFPGGFRVFGSLWIIGLAYVTYFLPVAIRQMTGPVVQLSEELEDASRIAGASHLETIRRVVFPLLLPGIGAGFLLALVTFTREFANSVLLYQSGTEVLSVVMYSYYSNGQLPEVATISVLTLVVLVSASLALHRLFKLRISF